MNGPSRLERVVEAILTVGLALSASMLLAGLVLDSPRALQAGIVLLMLTPVARVSVVTAGLFYARDWPFALLSLTVLGVLGSSAWLSVHR